LRDDGAIVYLNGAEVARSNMPGGTVGHLTPASTGISGADEYTFYDFTVEPGLLHNGTNVLAAEVHQSSATSSDLSFDLELEGLIPSLGAGDLKPGINRLVVQTFDGPDGSGNEIERGYVDIWYDTGLTNDYPKAGSGSNEPGPSEVEGSQPTGATTLRLIVPDGYLPGVPVLVRLEVLGSDGTIDRNLWDAAATLSVEANPGVNLSTNGSAIPDRDQATLYNGLGSALVGITGGGDFTLAAEVNGSQATAALKDLSAQPIKTVSGTLSTSQTWSGIYHITGGDFTIPDGVTLTLNPGTLVLIDGVPSGENGTDIEVAGSVKSLGTAASPVTFTAYTINPRAGAGGAPAVNGGAKHRLGPQTRGPGDANGTGVDPAGRKAASCLVWLTAVGGIVDDSTVGSRANGKIETFVIKAAFVAESWVINKTFIAADIWPGRAGKGHQPQVTARIGEAAKRDVGPLVAKTNSVDQGAAIGGEQANIFATGAELEIGVQTGIGYLAVRPYQQIAAGRDRSCGGVIGRNLPHRGLIQIVGKIHAAYVNGGVAVIVDFDPVIVLALRVFDNRGIGC
jgi:hypothetical protein